MTGVRAPVSPFCGVHSLHTLVCTRAYEGSVRPRPGRRAERLCHATPSSPSLFAFLFSNASPFSLCCPSFYTTLARPQSLHVRVYKQGEGFYGPGRGYFWQDKTPEGTTPPLAITTKRMDGPSNWYTVYHAPSYTFPPTQTTPR